MRFGQIVWRSLLGISLAGTLHAETNVTRSLTLPEVIRLAVEHNFDVRIQRIGPEIARFNLESAYAYYVPTFDLSVVHRSSTSEGGLNSITGATFPASTSESQTVDAGLGGYGPLGMNYSLSPNLVHSTSDGNDFFTGFAPGLSLSQPLLRNFLIDAGRQNILVSKKNIKISEAALSQQIINTVTAVEQAYYDLIFARENIKVQQMALQLNEQLLAENRKRVEVGTLAPLDEKQAESQVAQSRADLLTAQQAYQTQQNLVKNLFTDNYSEWHAIELVPVEKLVAVPERFDIMESWQAGLSQRPDLLQAKLDLERRDIVLRYQRNQILPQLDLTGSVGWNGKDRRIGGVFEDEIMARNPTYTVGAVFSVPLSSRGPRNLYRATKAEKEQAILRFKQLEQQIMVDIDNAIKVAQTDFQRIDATRKAREYAEAAVDAERRKLEAGKSTSFVVLQLQSILTAARSAEIRALADYNKALSQVSFNIGSTLDRNRLSIGVQ